MAQAGFLQYEQENNRLLNALRHRPEFSDILDFIRDKKAALLVPQEVSLGKIYINLSFVQTHVVVFAADGSNRFVSVNGLRGRLVNDTHDIIHVVGGPLSEKDDALFSFLSNPLSVFEPGRGTFAYPNEESSSVRVLRRSSVQISNVTAPFFSISRPLTFPDCPWLALVDQGLLDDAPLCDLPANVSLRREPLTNYEAEPHDGQNGANQSAAEDDLVMQDKEMSLTDLVKLLSSGQSDAGSESGLSQPEAIATEQPGSPAKQIPMPWKILKVRIYEKATLDMKAPLTSLFRLIAKAKEGRTTMAAIVAEYQALMETVFTSFQAHPDWAGCAASALEGLESKLCSKLYPYVFGRSDRQGGSEDDWLTARIEALHFITAEHLEIAISADALANPIEEAGAWLKRMNRYKPPAHKLTCLVNTCKHILGILPAYSTANQPLSADDLLPMIILTLLRTNPLNLPSNLSFISNFRVRRHFTAEEQYFHTIVSSAVCFVESMTSSQLNISSEVFDYELARSEIRLGQPVQSQSLWAVGETPTISQDGIMHDNSAVPISRGAKSLRAYVEGVLSHQQPPLEKFQTATVEDLDMNDIPVLLNDYQRMVDLVERYRSVLKVVHEAL